MVAPVVNSVLIKCVWIPAVVLGIAVALGFRGLLLASMMVIFCCPSAGATYSFCAGYCGNPRMASQIVVYSTAFSIFSMFLWLFAFLQLGLL
jgi:predicted permease